MQTPIDRGDQPLSAYLLKIITLLVKKAGGEIRIDAVEMMDDPNGDGITKFYDRDKKQLVLSYIREGSEVLFTKVEDDPWQRNSNSLSSQDRLRSQGRSSIVQPLRQSDLTEPSISSHERSASTLDDQRISELEDQMRKEAAARILASFPGTPVTEPASQPRPRVVNQRRVPPSFFRT